LAVPVGNGLRGISLTRLVHRDSIYSRNRHAQTFLLTQYLTHLNARQQRSLDNCVIAADVGGINAMRTGCGYTQCVSIDVVCNQIATKDTDAKKSLLTSTSFNFDSIIPYLREKRISSYVIILDCCRSEKAINSPSIRQRNYSNTEIINEDFFGSGKIIISASSNYQESLELDDLENGLFTYYFLEGLKSRTLIEANGYVSIKKLYDYTFSKIISNHPSIDQRPIFSGEDYSGEIIIRVESKKDLQRDFNFEHADLSKKTKAKLKWDKIYEKNHLDFGLLGRLRKIIQYGNVIVLSDSLRVMSYLALCTVTNTIVCRFY
jgi:hypothetical protein